MLTVVVIVLLLTGRADPYTFTGGTEYGSFTCHCDPDVQCDDETGACPGGRCDTSGTIGWYGTACQYGNVAHWRGRADQTGDGDHEADRCIDGNSNRNITQGSCCNPTRSSGELSWTVDLGGTFAIDWSVNIYYAADDVYRNSIRGMKVYVSTSRTPTDDELCRYQHTTSSLIAAWCRYKLGRYVTIRQPNMTIEEMMFCEVKVNGHEYYPCGFYDGDYRWGRACLENCRCEHQCDVINGTCDGDCIAGSRKEDRLNNRCLLSCDPGFWGLNCESDCHCDQQCDNIDGECDGDCIAGWRKGHHRRCDESCDLGFGDMYCYPCRCLDVSEVCDVTTGHCESGCDDSYIGVGCNIVKPSLRESTITFTEDKDVVTATITDIEYRTELVSEYLVQYKLLHEDTFISINVNPISGRRRREVGEDDVVLQIPFSDQSINSQYEFRITPLISLAENNGVIGLSSNITLYNSGCLHYTGLPSCNHWCMCSNDPDTLCLLTCDYCHVCDSEPELPSGENVNFEITDITTNSLRIRFKNAHPDLPLVLVFLTRLRDHYANISSLASNTDYTYSNLGSNTVYDIDITAILEDDVLSKSWTLTAKTLTKSSNNTDHTDNNDNNSNNGNNDNNDNILPVVVGSVVSVTGVVALLVVISILYKRRKAKQSQEETSQDQQSEESLDDFTDESSMSTCTRTSNDVYLTPVATPGEEDSGAVVTPSNVPQEQQCEEINDYVNESSMRTFTHTYDNVYPTSVATPGDWNSGAVVTPNNVPQEQQCEEINDYVNVTPGDGCQQLETRTRQNNTLYINENRDSTSV